MVASAQGVDISQDQSGWTTSQFKEYSFAFVKATDGPSLVDAHFEGNWATAKTAGIHRGAYHELWSPGAASPVTQAKHFIDVMARARVEPGDMLAVVSSDYAGVTGAEVLTVLNMLRARFTQSPVLLYSDLSHLPSLVACKGFPLWLADYQSTWPVTEDWNCRFWQWSDSSGRLDRDAFNGTAAELQAWIDSYVTPAKPVAPKPVTPVKPVTPPVAAVVTETEAEQAVKELEGFITEHV